MPATATSSWQTTTGQYVITYTITENMNLDSSEQALLEYGTAISSSGIPCASSRNCERSDKL